MSLEFIPIEDLCSKNLKGLVEFNYAPAEWINPSNLDRDGFLYTADNTGSDYLFFSGRDWLKGFYQNKSLKYNYDHKDSDNNDQFSEKLSGIIISDTPAIAYELAKMKDFRFVLRIKDKNGRYRHLGTPVRPLRFTYSKIKSHSEDVYRFEFSGLNI